MDTDAVVAASINKTLAGPTARDYYLAARYYLDADHEDMAQAAEWAAKSNEMDPKYWQLRVEALILGKMGNYNRAIEVAQSSIAMAKEAGNMQRVQRVLIRYHGAHAFIRMVDAVFEALGSISA